MGARFVNLRLVVRVTVVCFWAVMMGLLYAREVRPYIARPASTDEDGFTYQALLDSSAHGPARMNIYWLGRRVGETLTTYQATDGAFHINTRTRISAGLLGRLFPAPEMDVPDDYNAEAEHITITTTTVLGAEFELVSLSAVISGAGASRIASVDGRVIDDGLRLTVTDPAGATHYTRLPFDADLMLAPGPTTLVHARDLEVGMRWRMGMINPLTGRYETGTATVARREKMIWDGRAHNTYVVEVRWGPMTSTAWVSPDGRLLKQEAPLGVVLVRVPSEADSSPGGEG